MLHLCSLSFYLGDPGHTGAGRLSFYVVIYLGFRFGARVEDRHGLYVFLTWWDKLVVRADIWRQVMFPNA
jgi:hypothetical protein